MNASSPGYVARFCRRRPKLSALVFGYIFLNLVPIWPYTPTCKLSPGDRISIEGEMSDAYRSTLKYAFARTDLYYWDIGGVILIRVLSLLDGPEFLNYYEDLHNANNKAARGVAWRLEAGRYGGYEYNGRIHAVAEFLESLRDPKTGEFEHSDCSYIVPLVTGRPIPISPTGNAAQ